MFKMASLLAGFGLLVVFSLLLSVGGGTVTADDPTPTAVPAPVLGEFDPASVADIDLLAYPVVPEELSGFALALYREALDQGSSPNSFVKVGDCMTDNPNFLLPIGEGNYDLGEYADLESVITTFSEGDENSFARTSQAAAGGFNTASILDSMWANPEFCEAGESPLTCEFRIMQPSVALIMFGTNDLNYLTAEQFDFFLRSIVAATIENKVLPVLSTFPSRPEFPEQSVLYNQIVVKVAQDYGVPLINLWAALEPLPNRGVDPEDPTHMTEPEAGLACYFNDDTLQAGFTVRNLVTLQTLDLLLKQAED